MPKMKTHKGAKNRVRLTAKGKVRFKRSFAGHLMSGKSGSRVRRARKPSFLSGAIAKRVKRLVGG
ncbi:MAG: 50S ribosomal protein L35 [Phycisphaerae bacterium]